MRANYKINSLKTTVQILFGQVHTANLKESLKPQELSQKMMESNGLPKLINKILKEKKNGITGNSNSTTFRALAAKISTHLMVTIVA